MGRIQLEILPWISDVLDGQGAGRLVLEKTIEEGATIGDVIRKLAREHQAFSDTIFDTKTDKLSSHVMIVLNDRVMEALKGLDTNIKDGDIIKLLPVIAGG
ncbi:MoaD/ThiS family protein [Chloroflexota bacterium]